VLKEGKVGKKEVILKSLSRYGLSWLLIVKTRGLDKEGR
jgi:hypothetical protein